MKRSLHQPPDSVSVSVSRSAGVGQDVSLLREHCGPILLCMWGSDVSVTEAFYNASDQESLPSVLGCKLGDQEKKRAQHTICKSCAIRLGGWINRRGLAMPFAVPVVWREPSNHSSDCYFCLTSPVASGMNRKGKQSIDYLNITSAIRPVPHGEDLPVPDLLKEYNLNSETEEEDTEKTGHHEEEPTDPDFQDPASESAHKLTQNELNDLVGDLELPKVKAELLASRMKQWRFLDEGVKISLIVIAKKIWKNSTPWRAL